MAATTTSSTRPRTRDRGAVNAFAISLVSVVLLWPFGVVLGPAALWLGISAQRRVSRSEGRLRGERLAIAAIAVAGVVSALYVATMVSEVVVLVTTGGLIPAY